MKHFATNDFLEAIRELIQDQSTQYAEDCARAALRCKLVDIDQFTAAMRILHP